MIGILTTLEPIIDREIDKMIPAYEIWNKHTSAEQPQMGWTLSHGE